MKETSTFYVLQEQQQNFASCSSNYDGDSYQRHLFHFSKLNIWWHNYLLIKNRIYKKVMFLKPVFCHDCVQITDYKVHVYMLHVVCNMLHTDNKVLLYKLHVTCYNVHLYRLQKRQGFLFSLPISSGGGSITLKWTS